MQVIALDNLYCLLGSCYQVSYCMKGRIYSSINMKVYSIKPFLIILKKQARPGKGYKKN